MPRRLRAWQAADAPALVRKKKKRGKSAYGAELLLAADADGALRRPEPSEQPDGAVRHHPSPSARADAEAAVVPLTAPVRRRSAVA